MPAAIWMLEKARVPQVPRWTEVWNQIDLVLYSNSICYFLNKNQIQDYGVWVVGWPNATTKTKKIGTVSYTAVWPRPIGPLHLIGQMMTRSNLLHLLLLLPRLHRSFRLLLAPPTSLEDRSSSSFKNKPSLWWLFRYDNSTNSFFRKGEGEQKQKKRKWFERKVWRLVCRCALVTI